MSAADLLAPPRTLRWLASLAPASRLEAAVGPGLLRRHPLPSRRVGLCQPRVPWGGQGRGSDRRERNGSRSPRAVRFPELWDLHPGLGSDTCRLLRCCWRPAVGFPRERVGAGGGELLLCASVSLRHQWWACGVAIPADWTRVRADWLKDAWRTFMKLAQMNGQ